MVPDLPPPRRPSYGRKPLPSPLSDKAEELDLWDLDDDHQAKPAADKSGPLAASGSPSSAWGAPVIPQPRKPRLVIGEEEDVSPPPATAAPAPEKPAVGRGKIRTGKTITTTPDEVSFEDLEDPESIAAATRAGSTRVADPASSVAAPAMATHADETVADSAPPLDAVAAGSPPVAEVLVRRRVSSVPLRSLMPDFGLSRVERAGLWALVVLLVIGMSAYLVSIFHLPKVPARAGEADFPVAGEVFTVESATTYWSEPQVGGPDADTVRRGTRLLPVLEMTLSRGPGAVRVMFRNEDREVVGDVITRSVASASRIRIAATAGFDEYGMHAAYRTGGRDPWFIEVHEAVSADLPGSAFTKLLEIEITSALR
ncbi:MAG: hypothetical protein FJ385_06780 [Verrucomicrobia bacterium]|nr:hypothetical protein [Verrucomicrobiota bacterium]